MLKTLTFWKRKKIDRTDIFKISSPDRWLVITIIVLALVGILMVFDSSVAIALRDFADQYHFVRDQIRWLIIGFGACLILSFVDYHLYYRISGVLLGVTIFLLLIVYVPGIGVRAQGAHRWINLGFFILQPAELAKLSLTIYLSAWLSRSQKNRLTPFIAILFLVCGLVIAEPDLGTGIIILLIGVSIYFMSGAPVRGFLLFMPLIVIATIILAAVSPYRMKRIQTFLHPESDPLGASYQIRQVLLGLGSGGITGVGIGQSRQKYEYLPEANTDSIFAIIGEEVGFIGGTTVMILFGILLWRCFRISKRAPDAFGRLLASGVATWIGIQVIINLGAMVALLPLTGVPLPLISYGGSSLVILLTGLGVVINISKYRVIKDKT